MPTKNKTIRVQRKPARSAPKKEKEVTLLGKILRGAGGAAGSALGGLLGQPAFGAAAGTGLGAAVSKWLGAGLHCSAEQFSQSGSRHSDDAPQWTVGHHTTQRVRL